MATATVPAEAPKKAPLPTPREYPTADIVIYDGHCKFCEGMVRRLAWFDGKGRIVFLSLHDPEVARRFPDLTYDQMMEQMWLVTQQGQRYGGAAVLRYLSRKLPKLYWLAPFIHVPFTLPLWQWGYKQVARRRYLILGKTDASCEDGACAVHFRK
jgi:predicted DCC family thiol-disulfide oxidoreductase YuxK